MTNTSKLKGRMAEMGFTLSSLSEALHISRPSLRKKITGATDFRVSEIEKMCPLLKINKAEINEFFFADNVPVLERCQHISATSTH